MGKKTKTLFDQDQKDRSSEKIDRDAVSKRDRERKEKAERMIEDGILNEAEAEDYYHLAMLYQHGETTQDYLIANLLARIAMDKGEPRAPWLVAASWDRYLTHYQREHRLPELQKYGTQNRLDESTGKWRMIPVDPRTSDEERAKLNVPPLKELQKRLDR